MLSDTNKYFEKKERHTFRSIYFNDKNDTFETFIGFRLKRKSLPLPHHCLDAEVWSKTLVSVFYRNTSATDSLFLNKLHSYRGDATIFLKKKKQLLQFYIFYDYEDSSCPHNKVKDPCIITLDYDKIELQMDDLGIGFKTSVSNIKNFDNFLFDDGDDLESRHGDIEDFGIEDFGDGSLDYLWVWRYEDFDFYCEYADVRRSEAFLKNITDPFLGNKKKEVYLGEKKNTFFIKNSIPLVSKVKYHKSDLMGICPDDSEDIELDYDYDSLRKSRLNERVYNPYALGVDFDHIPNLEKVGSSDHLYKDKELGKVGTLTLLSRDLSKLEKKLKKYGNDDFSID